MRRFWEHADRDRVEIVAALTFGPQLTPAPTFFRPSHAIRSGIVKHKGQAGRDDEIEGIGPAIPKSTDRGRPLRHGAGASRASRWRGKRTARDHYRRRQPPH